MGHNVKGILFVDYVRMLRRCKDVDWSDHLQPEDLEYLDGHIEPSGWYPMPSFERMGLAILKVIGQGNLDSVRVWGRMMTDELVQTHLGLLVAGDPRESVARFFVLRESFFDYPALQLRQQHERHFQIAIDYGMSGFAEEAASLQAVGFFERLLELSGAHQIDVELTAEAWAGAPETLLDLRWADEG